ncbi:signal peptide-containing protein [Theileria equi strain WA]|uniref:Signal peptide-containing protein n=1 Tax=Theileria equi strain WA TaxID=1537102 RepID=L0AZ15_THEEQ|nr:signal peptide-containing protein [Theileria equi strain WA]AFZ80832.1 signal peptide-containing protein [Theileria equi strain WA]|eukprot:XP_004830498.1 signal peptide-containing protein [Theileria equi strain WA]
MEATWLLIFLSLCGFCCCTDDRRVFLVLDVARLDIRQVNIEKKRSGEVEQIKFEPKEGVIIASVTYKRQNLWIGKNGETFSSAISYSKDGHLPLLFLNIRDKGSSRNSYFARYNDLWKPISKEDFGEKRKRMVNGLPSDYISAASFAIPLDLTALDFEHVVLSKGVIDGVTYVAYFADSKAVFTSVVLKTGEVWFGDAGQECTNVSIYFRKKLPALISLQISYCGEPALEYFAPANGTWLKISHEEFNEKFENLKDASKGYDVYSKSAYTPIQVELDLANVQLNKIKVQEKKSGTVNLKFFSVDSAYSLGRVCSGKSTIWKPESDEECRCVVLFSKKGYPPILALSYETIEEIVVEYFEKKGRKWINIQRKGFNEKIEKMREGEPSLTHGKALRGYDSFYIMDINSLCNNNLQVVRPSAESPYLVIHPLPGTTVTEVVEGEVKIWKRKDSEDCFSASFMVMDGDPKLAKLMIRDGSRLFTLYFKREDLWVKITAREYNSNTRNVKEEYEIDDYDDEEDSFFTVSHTLLILTLTCIVFL